MERANAYAVGCILAAVVLLVAGCGSGRSVVGGSYDDFTAYFNTFYNAQSTFEEGKRTVEGQSEPVDRSVYLSVFPVPDRGRSQQNFRKTIQKSADVLRSHPNSRWVDDALMLIGKSYFYLENFVGAQQKFQEVISLESTREDEARFWLARAQIASRDFEGAMQHLQQSLQRENLSDEWRPEMQLALGEVHVKQGRWKEAVTQLREGLESIGDRDLEARTLYLLGQVHETTGAYEEATAAFEEAHSRRPRYELGYAAEFSSIRVQGMHTDPERALERLARMESDDKHYEHRAELVYLRGRIHQAQGRLQRAASLYRGLLYRSNMPLQNVRPRIHFALAELYRDHYDDYVTAAAHFDTAATALGRSSVDAEVARTPEAITEAQELADVFGSYSEVRLRISRMDSLLHLGSLSTQAFREKVLEMRRQKARRMDAQQAAQDQREIAQSFRNRQTEQGQQTQAASQTAGTGAGFLFHQDPVRVQEGMEGFVQQWSNRPLVDNWRRLSAISAIADEEAEVPGGVTRQAPGLAQAQGRENLPVVDISDIPRDTLGRAQMLADRAYARYELGNILFLLMNEPASAAEWYRRVIEENGDLPVANRAYYALAEVRRAQGEEQEADRLYRRVLERNPEGELARRVRRQLEMQPAGGQAVDSVALAESAYEEAYGQWRAQQYRKALTSMVKVAGQYTSTPVAPKALLAAGSIYMEWARRDTLDLAGGVPLALSDSLLTRIGLSFRAPDTTMAAPDTTVLDSTARSAAADSTLRPVPTGGKLFADASLGHREVPLAQFYTTIARQYPSSPQAGQARDVLAALEERGLTEKEAASQDTSSASPQVRRQMQNEVQQGRAEPPQRQGVQSSRPAEDRSPRRVFSYRGRTGLVKEEGGFTWIVASHGSPEPARKMVERYRQMGYRSSVLVRQVDGQRRHQVAVGQFRTREAARRVESHLPPGASPSEVGIVAISPQ